MDLVQSMPPVTRVMIISMALIGLSCSTNMASPYDLALLWPWILKRWQWWRIMSAFLFPGLGLQMLYNGVFFLEMSRTIESSVFLGDTAEYVWSLMGISSFILAFNYPLGSPFLFQPLSSSLTALFSIHLPHVNLSLLGVFSMPGKYVALGSLGISLIAGGVPECLQCFTGIAAGYLWHVLKNPPRPDQDRRHHRILSFIGKYISPRLQVPTALRHMMARTSPIRRTSFGTVYPSRRSTTSMTSSRTKPAREQTRPDRAAILAATEARLRATAKNEK